MSASRRLGWAIALLASAATAAAGQTAPPAHDADPAPAVQLRLDDHPTIDLFDRAVRIELKGRFDADVIALGGEAGTAGPDWSGRRLGFGLRVGRTVEGEVSRELDDARPWRDVHLTWRPRPWLYLRGGRFKVPFSEERVRSLTDQDFLERSLAARTIAPGRDVGALAGGRVAGRRLDWEAGVFEGRGEAWPRRTPLESTPASPLVAVRVGVRPLAAERHGRWRSLRGAVAFTAATRDAGLTGVEARTILDRATFSLPAFVQGPERRIGLEAHWSPGRLRFHGEWLRLSQARQAQGLDGADLAPLRTAGWHAGAVWQIFRRRGRDRGPATDWLRTGEIGIRVEGLTFQTAAAGGDLAETLPASRHRAVTLGTTWAVHRWLAIQVDVVHERLAEAGIAVFAGTSRTTAGVRWRTAF